jgi:hypothetical protein
MGTISGLLATQDSSDIPVMGTSTQNASGVVSAATASASIAAVTGETAYLTGFEFTGGGATSAALKTLTITGLLGGTRSYTIAVPAGTTLGCQPLVVYFYPALPASATNTAITVSIPTLGAGNTASSVNCQGFYL